jgi:hypothetical protein
MIVGSSQLWKKYYCAAFLKQIPNFNLLLIVTSGILFALFNPVFVCYIRFFTINKHQKICFFQYKLQIRPVLEQTKFMRVGFSQQPNLKM